MRYKLFGRSGMRVSEICLGAMTFGGESGFGAAQDECRKIFDAFIDAGGNFVDTANMYTGGTSERMLSEFIAAERDRLVLATKYTNNMQPDDPNAGGNHRKNMVHALEASLKRLDTDYVDLYWVHMWDGTTPVDEIMRALDDMVRAGKVLHVGVSNWPAWIISYANAIAERNGWTPFSGMQLQYNLVERSIEADFFDLARFQDMAITPWSPLAGGLLTGKFNRDADEKAREGARLTTTRWSPITDEKLDVAEKATEIANEIGCTTAQVALSWMRQNDRATVIPIIGAKTVDQLKENLACLEVELDDTQIQALNEIGAPTPTYPASLFVNPHIKRMIHGEMADRIDNPHDPR